MRRTFGKLFSKLLSNVILPTFTMPVLVQFTYSIIGQRYRYKTGYLWAQIIAFFRPSWPGYPHNHYHECLCDPGTQLGITELVEVIVYRPGSTPTPI